MRRATDGATVVGVPVGTAEYLRGACARVVKDAIDARHRVANRLSAQAAVYLLRTADGWPAVVHMFRGVAPELARAAAVEHDAAAITDFAQLMNMSPRNCASCRYSRPYPCPCGWAGALSRRRSC